MITLPGLLAFVATEVLAQTIQDFGSSGGNGPKGGIGDLEHPVLYAQSFITDGAIQLSHLDVELRQLADFLPPLLNFINTTSCNPKRAVVVDDSTKGARQEMLGFGHAITDSTVEVFNSLEPDVFDQVMRDLFGQDGNNMGFMRHTMGSSDLSRNQYSYDDNGPSFNEGEPDLELENFDLGPDGRAMASMIATMGEYKSDVFLFGSPWSYPGWMKYNGLFVAPNLLNAYNILNNSFDNSYIPQAIEYFTKYVDAYKSYGVTVNGITLQNEPLNYQGGYPCMYLDADDAAAIINQGLGDAMAQRDVKIIAYDHNQDQPVYPARTIREAAGRVDASGWHCYASQSYAVFNDLNYAFPGIPQFLTECSSYLPYDFSLYLAQEFLVTTQRGSSGGAFWVLATNPTFGPSSPYGGCDGCLGSIVVNSTTVYTKTHDYYMMGQFSRFIRRGSTNYRVLQGITGDNTGQQFLVNSIKNPDGSWAVVFLNNIGSDQDVELSFSSRPGDFWAGTIPNLAVVTWLIPSDSVLAQNISILSATSTALYPMGNSSIVGPTGTGTGTGMATGRGASTCPATTTMMSSSSSSSGTPLLPVPHTDHTITGGLTGTVPTTTGYCACPTTPGSSLSYPSFSPTFSGFPSSIFDFPPSISDLPPSFSDLPTSISDFPPSISDSPSTTSDSWSHPWPEPPYEQGPGHGRPENPWHGGPN